MLFSNSARASRHRPCRVRPLDASGRWAVPPNGVFDDAGTSRLSARRGWARAVHDMPLRPCAEHGCPRLVDSSRCPEHQRAVNRRRGTATARGYTSYWTNTFRPWFTRELVAHGIAPICGAALPDGPGMADSLCRVEGRLTAHPLHLDHDPPLQDHERAHRRLVCDPLRVGFLGRACHARKTR